MQGKDDDSRKQPRCYQEGPCTQGRASVLTLSAQIYLVSEECSNSDSSTFSQGISLINLQPLYRSAHHHRTAHPLTPSSLSTFRQSSEHAHTNLALTKRLVLSSVMAPLYRFLRMSFLGSPYSPRQVRISGPISTQVLTT